MVQPAEESIKAELQRKKKKDERKAVDGDGEGEEKP
jgi:hypothetical protein